MQIYLQAFSKAYGLLVGGDPRVVPVVLLSLLVSGSAIGIATVLGVPLGYVIGTTRFKGRSTVMLFVNTAMGFPPVVVGLFVYLALTRLGPLGFMNWLFTPQGMILAQVFLAAPLVVGVSAAAFGSVARDLGIQVRSLGASRFQEAAAIMKEARRGLMAAIIAGFGAIISEVGAVSIVGGGIEGHTDVMTTAIMANVSRGDNGTAMAWAFILIGIAFSVNIALTAMQHAGVSYER